METAADDWKILGEFVQRNSVTVDMTPITHPGPGEEEKPQCGITVKEAHSSGSGPKYRVISMTAVSGKWSIIEIQYQHCQIFL